LTGESHSTQKESYHGAAFPTENPIWNAQGLNTGLHIDKPGMNCHHSFVQNTMERMLRTTDG